MKNMMNDIIIIYIYVYIYFGMFLLSLCIVDMCYVDESSYCNVNRHHIRI